MHRGFGKQALNLNHKFDLEIKETKLNKKVWWYIFKQVKVIV